MWNWIIHLGYKTDINIKLFSNPNLETDEHLDDCYWERFWKEGTTIMICKILYTCDMERIHVVTDKKLWISNSFAKLKT